MTMYYQILAFICFITVLVLIWLALIAIVSTPFWYLGEVMGKVASVVILILTMPLVVMIALRLMGVSVW